MNDDYEIIIFSNFDNTNVVGIATNIHDNQLYLVTNNSDDKEKLVYSLITVADETGASLVSYLKNGLMSKEDKKAFDSLMKYVNTENGQLDLSSSKASMKITDEELALQTENNKLQMNENETTLAYNTESNSRVLKADAQSLSYKAKTVLESDKNLENKDVWKKFIKITSNLTNSGSILAQIDKGTREDVSDSVIVTPKNYGKCYIDVNINSQKDLVNPVLVIRNNKNKNVLATLDKVSAGFRKYQIAFTISSISDALQITIFSYAECFVQFDSIDVHYPDMITDFSVGDSMQFKTKSSSEFDVVDNILKFLNEGARTTIKSDIIEFNRANIDDKVVLNTTENGVGFFDRLDYKLSNNSITVTDVTLKWK